MKNVKSSNLLLRTAIILMVLLLVFPALYAQTSKDSIPADTSKVKKHSPTKASLFSTFVPGLGQAYNKKYWKIPIIYVGSGILGYLANKYGKEYQRFRKAYNAVSDDDPTTVDEFNGQVSKDDLYYWKEKYRRSRDLDIIGLAGIYILNIVDASVDAHLFDFDISDDLSFRIEPVIFNASNQKTVTGIRCTIGIR
jgi:hypothetical protein